MVRVLYRTLLHEPARTALSMLAVAAAIALVLVFEGFRAGLYHQVRALPEGIRADLIATQAGVANILGARSVLPRSARRDVESVPGVKVAHPLGGMPVIYTRGAASAPVYVIAYDTAGGPRTLVAGRQIADPDEIVVDAPLAARFGVGPGDRVEVLGHAFTIAGLSGGPSSFFNPPVFVRVVDLVDLFLAGELPAEIAADAAVSYLLVEVQPGTDLRVVRADIERRVPAVDVFTPAELGEADVARARKFLGAALDLLVGIAWAVGILVVALTLYASVVARSRQLGIMKAIGTGRLRLACQVIGEALVLSALGLGVGMAMAAGAADVITVLRPQYAIEPLDPSVVARAALAAAAIACIGAIVPIRRLARVDPAVVFRQGE